MPLHRCRRMMFLYGFAFAVTSGAYASAEDKRGPVLPDPPNPKMHGDWTPVVTLRDATDTFKGTKGPKGIKRPTGGWYVSPIHANLLADGKVLITGWNRPSESECRDHQGRLYGVSFVLNVEDLKDQKVLKITPLDEQPLPRKGKTGDESDDVLYCSGHAPLADGRILFMGGARYKQLGDVEFPTPFNQDEFGLNYARLYHPGTAKFVRVAKTNPGGPAPPGVRSEGWERHERGDMWYPTNTRLPGGRVLVNGGLSRWVNAFPDPGKPRLNTWRFLNSSATIFDPAAHDRGQDPWTVWVSHAKAPREVGIDVFDYTKVFLLPRPVAIKDPPDQERRYHVAVYGGLGGHPDDESYRPGVTLLSLDEDVPEDRRFKRPGNSARPNGGKGVEGKLNEGKLHETTASMTADGRIVIMGGGNNGLTEGQRIDVYDPYTDSWRSADTRVTRHKPSSTLLPDGTVLVVNGEEYYDTPRNTGDRTKPTLFDPVSGTVINLAAGDDAGMRGYHAVSLLLKDGSVLIGGGRVYESNQEGKYRIGCERPELRVFRPPYLCKGEGTRPVIGGGTPGEITVGGKPFTVKFTGPKPRAKGGVVLMALGAHTHSFDQNQRIVPLAARVIGPGEVTVAPPGDTWVAPEGEYNLFLVSDEGVPSVAATVRVVGRR